MGVTAYLKELLRHWWPLLSCAVFTILTLLQLYFSIPNQIAFIATIGLAVAMLQVAGYLVWRDAIQSSSVLEHRLANPKLSLEIHRILLLTMNSQPTLQAAITEGKPVLYIECMISNPRGPATGLKDWQITLKQADRSETGNVVYVRSNSSPDNWAFYTDAGRMLVGISSNWVYSSLAPIAPGSGRQGWIVAMFPESNVDSLATLGYSVTLSVSDIVAETRHEGTRVVLKRDGQSAIITAFGIVASGLPMMFT